MQLASSERRFVRCSRNHFQVEPGRDRGGGRKKRGNRGSRTSERVGMRQWRAGWDYPGGVLGSR